ncbi:MAG TPA: peptidoglycan DD-metalloendopeptidase family protein [Patescibacteria group bacterium]|nr:peptidoglycan DD-metalloendopeptidase family protein [Patescibacteria group bacterium]
MAERHYTIMIVPGSRAKLFRLRVRRSVLLGLASVAVFGLFAAGLLPVIYYKAVDRSHQVASLRKENEKLREASKEISSLKDQVAYFESKANKFALMAGVQDLPSSQGGGGLRPDAAETPADPSLVRDEIDNLKERSTVLTNSFNILEKVYHDQSLLLASTPSIAPVKGMIAYGYSWRKDPFTGQPAFHNGLDIVAPRGTRVLAPADGIVTKAGRETGYGNAVYLSHGNGVTTRYAHLDGFAVRPGQEIRRGDVLGYVGDTGRSLGAHLHYEVLVNNTKVDPSQYILDDRASY